MFVNPAIPNIRVATFLNPAIRVANVELPVLEDVLAVLPGADTAALVGEVRESDVDALPHPGLEPGAHPATRQLAHS